MAAHKSAGIHIVHQNIAGEVIVVDLEKGSYFSVLETGVFIWEGISSGLSRDQLRDEMRLLYDVQDPELEQNLDSFISKLKEEGLIVETTTIAERITSQTNKLPGKKLAFLAPQLHKYDDMADVLALDPIHDFDEAGWPNQPVAAQ